MTRLLPLVFALLALATAVVLTPAHAAEPRGDIVTAPHLLDGTIEDIQWTDLKNVFILTRPGTLYHSNDGGHTFLNQMNKIPDGVHHVSAMYISEKNPHNVLFTGRAHENFHTRDMGATYQPCFGIQIQDVRLHPVLPDWILASSMSPGCTPSEEGPSGEHCFKILQFSQDFGSTWRPILNYVVQFDWAPPVGDLTATHRATDTLVYVTAHEHQRGSQPFGEWDKSIHFYSSTDFFATKQVRVPHGNRFLFGDYSYLFVASVNPKDETQVSLKISRDNTTNLAFHTAMLPGSIHLTEHSYTILDTSEGSVFLHVNHLPFAQNAYAGHVYSSDWTGLSYSLSLPYNHRNLEGKADFEKVEGLEGIYLANFVDEELMAQEDQEEAEQLSQEVSSNSRAHRHGSAAGGIARVPKRERLRTKTVVTFDKGGEWSYLVPPTHDSLGMPIKCHGECHLHLHGVTDAYGPFYSTPTAVGLIMGTGTIGTYLQQHPSDINTYLSRDAGLTWFEVAKGSHIYEFGNHGALIAMAPDDRLSDSILYSYDEGASWVTHRISDVPFQIENIIIEPEANSHIFLVYGFKDEEGIVVHVDFEGLHARECQGHDNPDAPESDYERWSPSDRRLNGKCLLGRTVTYIRRKRLAQCYVPEAFERPVQGENCPCTASDFECDYGYERKRLTFAEKADGTTPDQLPCEPMASTPAHANPFDALYGPACSNGARTYRITKGYRRVPGDTCYGGAEWDAVEAPCPSWLSGTHIGKIILALLILIAVSLLIVLIGSKAEPGTPLARFFAVVRSRAAAVKYAAVGGADAAPHSMAEDEAFYLSEDELGPSPHLLDKDGGSSTSFSVNSQSGDEAPRTRAQQASIKPLPMSTKAKAAVPTLAPPASSSH